MKVGINMLDLEAVGRRKIPMLLLCEGRWIRCKPVLLYIMHKAVPGPDHYGSLTMARF